MKLTKLHLFLLLLVVLLFSSMGFGVLEGNENIGDSSTSITSNKGQVIQKVNQMIQKQKSIHTVCRMM